jgi:hypothetical protein
MPKGSRFSVQTHDQGQTRRDGLQTGRREAENPSQKAIRDDAEDVLIYQDEMEIHRHPALTRM